MSDQTAEAVQTSNLVNAPVMHAAPATDVSAQLAPISKEQSDNGKLVGWVATAYGNARLAARTEKNLRLLERITGDSLTLVFDVLKLMGEVTVSGVKRLHRTIIEASAPQSLNNSSPPVSSDGGRLMLPSEVAANGNNHPHGASTELSAPQPPINPSPAVSSDGRSSVTSQLSPVAGAVSSSKKYALAKLMQALERDPDLEHNDPELCRKTHLGIAMICAEEFDALNIFAAVDTSSDPFSWRDQRIAAKARNLSSIGVEHGEKYCLLAENEIDVRSQDCMAVIHRMTALIGRADHDYNKAHQHNIKRLQFERSPDFLNAGVIEGMCRDAFRTDGGGKLSAEMFLHLAKLADERPGWESLKTRLREFISTD